MSERDEGGGPTPFMMLLGSLGAQVQMALGLIEDPLQKKRIIELDAARHGIDLLAVLETKTKGNLEDDEGKLLSALLTQLRLLYVEVARQQKEGGAAAGATGGGASEASPRPEGDAEAEATDAGETKDEGQTPANG